MLKIHFKIPFLIFFALTATIFAQAGRGKVLEGNKLFEEEKYDAANDAYRDAQVDNPTSAVIDYNIANTLYEKKKYEDAVELYNKVTKNSDDPLFQAQAYYNLGNDLFRMDKLQESILAYTEALKLNPDDEDARYNLEFARFKLKQNSEQQNQDQQPPEENLKPSDYAKKLKARAEKLAEEFKYVEAHKLMTDGLKVDKTVGAFNQFITRLENVVKIEAGQ